MSHRTVVRNGLVVDGTGAEPWVADVAIDDGRITEIGTVDAAGITEIDASGLVVAPGFVDAHTHLDAQLWWDPQGTPSSWHGVTSVVMGNCGVSFAPCRPEDREYLARMMESVEDIPAGSIMDGLPWDWQTYGEFLRSLSTRPIGLNAGGLVGHCAMRYYAMGEDSLGDSAATPDAQQVMEETIREAMHGGALGFSSSRTLLHRVPDGRAVPGTHAPMEELFGVGRVLADLGRGVIEVASRLHDEDGTTVERTLQEIRDLGRLALETGRPVTFNLTQGRPVPDLHLRVLEVVHTLRDQGADLRPQTTVRPIGWLYGLVHRTPFDRCPSWRRLRELTLAEKLEVLHDTDSRERLVEEVRRQPPAVDPGQVLAFPPGAARYDLDPEHSLSAHASRRKVTAPEAFIELALETEGRQLFNWPIFNTDMDAVQVMLEDDSTLLGLADAGAHVSQIMDASQPSYVLSYWARERGVFSLPEAVRRLTSDPAELFGIDDRGVLTRGARADLNVIDYDALQLDVPEYVHDLPNGAGRFVQRADGYRWTFVNGQAVVADGRPTGALPGRVLE